MNIVMSDLKDALVKYGIKNKMLAKGNSLAIKLNDNNVCIINIIDCSTGGRIKPYIKYKVQVYQTGNTLEENTILIPEFLPKCNINDGHYKTYYEKGRDYQLAGIYVTRNNDLIYYYTNSYDKNIGIYESQDLLELIPRVIEDLVEVINFYNGD